MSQDFLDTQVAKYQDILTNGYRALLNCCYTPRKSSQCQMAYAAAERERETAP